MSGGTKMTTDIDSGRGRHVRGGDESAKALPRGAPRNAGGRKVHRAAASRMLAAGASIWASLSLVSAMTLAESPTPNATITTPAPLTGSPIDSQTAVTTTPQAPRRVIRVEIHRKVYVTADGTPVGTTSTSSGSGTSVTSSSSSSRGVAPSPSRTPTRSTRSRAS